MRSLGQLLAELTEVAVGNGRWKKTQERLNSMQEAIKALARGDNIVSGPHITKRQLNPHTISLSGTPGGGGSAAAVNHPWRPFRSRYLGEGSPPANQALRIRITPATVGNRLPSNWNEEFILDASATGKWVYLEVTINDNGNPTSAEIVANESTVPTADLASDEGALPTTLYQPLFAYDSGEESVLRYYIVQRENLVVDITNSGGDCDSIFRTVQLTNA